MARFLLTLSALLAATAANAQQEPPPENLLGFLKPGAKVSVHMLPGGGDVMLRVFSPESYNIAKDSQNLSIEQLAEKYRSLANRIDQAKRYLDRIHGIANAHVNADKVQHNFGTLKAVGADYVLVEMEGIPDRRRVFSAGAIKRLYLDDPGVGLYASVGNRTVFLDRN